MTRGKRIAELGAGAALPSIVSALGGAAQVTVTDYPDEELIRNMAYNLDCNLGTSREKAVAMVGIA
jgi:nicotinamide N-methyltransferase